MAAFGVAGAGCGPSNVPSGQPLSSPEQSSATGDVPAGNVASLPVGSLKTLGREPLAIGHDDGGVYAMTLVCTHQGCEARVEGHQIVCPCHGSTYDANGNVVQGPAPNALEHYAVSADDAGNLTVHTGSVVDSATRLTV
jgi:nitrite reductase/ring-hydroxylating ferredoxin subunit